MRTFCFASALFGANVVFGMEECKPVLQIYQLQDISYTYNDEVGAMVRLIPDMVKELQEEYDNVEYGIATFTDKGIPMSGTATGWGGWGGHGYIEDNCYSLLLKSTEDTRKINRALAGIFCSGGSDYQEAQFDALLNMALDPNAEWRENTTSEGAPVAKFILLLTDSFPHFPGDAKYSIDLYNSDYGVSNYSATWYYNPGDYMDWVGLRNDPMVPVDTPRLVELNAVYGADFNWPAVLPQDRFDESYYADGRTCSNYEYADTKNPGFGELLRFKGIIPILLVTTWVDDAECAADSYCVSIRNWYRDNYGSYVCPEATTAFGATYVTDCTKEYYNRHLAQLNVDGILQIVRADTTSQQLVDTISSVIKFGVNDVFCKPSTTTSTTMPTIIMPTTTTPTTTTTTPTGTAAQTTVCQCQVSSTENLTVV